jgi:hypothetical protein
VVADREHALRDGHSHAQRQETSDLDLRYKTG